MQMNVTQATFTRTLAAGLVVASCFIAGCASAIKYGDKAHEEHLKQLIPIEGKISLYVCREQAWGYSKVRSTVVVDGIPIGMLLPKMFAHTTLNPGAHSLYLSNEAPLIPASKTGELKFEGKPGEVVLIWAGVTGGGWGILTVDHFETKADAIQCINDASYAVNAE